MDDSDYTRFLERLGELLVESDTRCFAWALLPNHFHLLLRTGNAPISNTMKKLLTSHAVNYNRRHNRVGHLFQNRYKSILCQEEAYLLELVRYIHLNPLRVNIVEDFEKLSQYPFCGHGVILGHLKNEWQDRQYILKRFGEKEIDAKRNYREFVRKGINQGKRTDLTGGGLLRSQGGWEGIKANRKAGDYQKGDERILGDRDFVEVVLAQAQERLEKKYRIQAEGYNFEKLLYRVSELTNTIPEKILDSGRDRRNSPARSILCYWATRELGLSQNMLAEKLNLTQSAVSYAVKRGRDIVKQNSYVMINGINS